MSLYFIALLPPQHIHHYPNQIKQHFAENYSSHNAHKSPPHFTLQSPFDWQDDNIAPLESCLQNFVAFPQESIPITLNNLGAFAARVIYIHVNKNEELLALKTKLMAHMEDELGIVDPVSKKCSFTPHMNVAFRDLTKQNFKLAWQHLKAQELYFQFTALHKFGMI